MRWPPLSIELQTHLVLLLGLLCRSVRGVAISGSVIVVGEVLGPLELKSNRFP